jgi:hypothetical protein
VSFKFSQTNVDLIIFIISRLVLPLSETIDIQTEDPFTERKLKYRYKRGQIFNEIPSAFDLIDSI